jgi:hypothetical protein
MKKISTTARKLLHFPNKKKAEKRKFSGRRKDN